MKQKNMDLQMMRLTSIDSPSKKTNKNTTDTQEDEEEEHGLYNQLSKKSAVTFDYGGNLIIVKQPKVNSRTNKVVPGYQIVEEQSQ